MITKGIAVRIKTSNGGDTVSVLLENYRPTYDAVIAWGNNYAIIARERITFIEPVGDDYII